MMMKTMQGQRLDATALLTDMTRDVFAMLAKLLEMKDLVRLDTAVTNRGAREALLEAMTTGRLCYQGSQGQDDMISTWCLRWLSLRGIALRGLSAKEDVPSSVAVAVARISPNLKYLHMNYDVNNGTYMYQLEACCPDLEEVRLRDSYEEARLDEGGALVLELARGDGGVYGGEYSFFCERARLNKDDWHRDASKGRRFGWRRFLYSMALIRAARRNETQIARRLIESDECNVGAVSSLGRTALYWSAAYHGNTELVRLLLQKDASNIDAQPIDGNKWTALMWACLYGRAAIIELLIRSDANIDLKDDNNQTAFQILDEDGGRLSQAEKTRLKDLPRLIKQERAQQQRNQA